ncbi:M16 family metallopeptidase [Mangrovibrevibacter kandeliae]|uniref:M16 family metallopeptidase n=1 Tax=Mangrovibrevibacter kandeliae TaxID=2968473 RepID=UPI0021179CF3|nr:MULTISPECIES: pitrilysin family protein [unclassified Aurantimonas]MCQ8782051.1 insulinase family protein [Aurantimonas sp. CSK15Z-1]MCW4115289.1 insulinase family protein [Aurantimonas sp. MSK8Z-1]
MTDLLRSVRVSALALMTATASLAPASAQTQPPAPPPPAATAAAAPDDKADEQQAQQKVEKQQSAIDSFFLDNGLQVVVLPDHRAPIVTQMIWYRVGAADEQRGTSGIAHFLEHLMFKGTKLHPEGEFSKAVADIGGEENAFTTADYTAYYQQVAASQLPMVMGFEADRMENLVLSDEAVLPERDVILEERRMRIENDPGSQLSEAVQAALFQNHPYGTPVIGWRSEMEKLTRDDAIAFYDKYYTPNNATLIVAGDVTADAVRKLAEETYGKVPRRADITPRVRPKEPPPLAARTVTMTDPRVTQPSLQRVYLAPSDATAPAGEAEALDVLADILGGGTTSRLYRSLIVKDALAAGAGAYYAGSSLDYGQFAVYGTPRGNATIGDVEKAIDAEIARILADGVTPQELEQAKNRVRKAVIYQRDNQASMARRYGTALSTGRTIADVDSWPDRIEAVTVDQVTAVARKYLRPERSVTGYLEPAADAETRS